MIIAVDFDGTLTEVAYPSIGKPKLDSEGVEIIEKVKHLKYNENWDVILWTCRTGVHLTQAIEWCKERGLEFDAINENMPYIVKAFEFEGRKIFANVYLDDYAVNVNDF